MRVKTWIGLAVMAILAILVAWIGDRDVTAGIFDSPLPDPPPNDDFDSATVIGGLPFSEALDASLATWASDDPPDCVNNGSVWYAFTPTSDMAVEMNTTGSDYDTVLSVYTGTRGALTLVPMACNDDYYGLQSRVQFQATAGTTYYAMVGTCCGNGGDGGGPLVFNAFEITAPQNDAFAGAVVVQELPFDHWSDTSGATIEPGEPQPECAGGSMGGTVWYSFTPEESGSVMARVQNAPADQVLAIYTGASLESLEEVVSCCGGGPVVAFQAQGGTTYSIQIALMWGYTGPVQVYLDEAPPPVVEFWYYPNEPSTMDVVEFYNYSWDPAGMGIESYAWDFGDGSSDAGCCPSHRYAADGDYVVELAVETYDGRVGSNMTNMMVRTHDISITGISTPRSAKANQTRSVVVQIANKRYPERVEVQLYKSGPWGFEWVGSMVVNVPARRTGGTTRVRFLYRYTAEDAEIGKVTFRANAYPIDVRDAFPADNEAITPPIKVMR